MKQYFLICVLLLLILTPSCSKNKNIDNNTYKIVLRKVEDPEMVKIKTFNHAIVGQEEWGCVFADCPDYQLRGWFIEAEVYDENNNKIEDPEINWSTDSPQCIRLVDFCGKSNRRKVEAFPGSEMGRGKIFAEYNGETGTFDITSYGCFRLYYDTAKELDGTISQTGRTDTGWSWDTLSIVPKNSPEADIWWEYDYNTRKTTIFSKYGIKKIGEFNASNFSLEEITTPSLDSFSDNLEVFGIYEVKDKNKNHYKFACIETCAWSYTQFAWDYFAEPTP